MKLAVNSAQFIPSLRAFKSQRGFTLIEGLVSLVVISLIGLLIVGLLTRTFRAGNKTELISTVKQNGQVALNNIDSHLRNALSISCVGSLSDTPLTTRQGEGTFRGDTAVIKKNDSYYRLRFTAANPSAATPTNGSVTIEKLILDDESQSFRNCQLTNINSNNLVDLVDTYSESSQSISVKAPTDGSSFFTLTRRAGSNDVIQVQFYLDEQVGIVSPDADQQLSDSGALFQTSVVVRSQ